MQFTAISSSKIQWDKNELFIVLVQPKIKITPFLKKLEKLSKNNINDILINSNLDDETINKASKACEAACNPIDDKRGTVAYRKKVSGVLFKRALQIALERANKG